MDLVELVEFKGKKITKGRELFNRCLPSDYPVVDEKIDKKKLSILLDDIVIKYPPFVVIETLDKIKTLGFMSSNLIGFSLSISELYNKKIQEMQNLLTGDVRKDMQLLDGPDVLELMKKIPCSALIESGSRGNYAQLRQMVFSRGYVSKSDNTIKKDLIKGNLVTGLTKKEFFLSCYGARKGMLDTAVSTGSSGYLTRQLIYSNVCVELSDEEDCGTTDGLEIKIEDIKTATVLLWRNYYDDNGNLSTITTKNFKSLIGKTIKLRSPIYCKHAKICKTCYGNLYKILHSDKIGIIATQAIGERVVQLVLRTFHLGGVAQSSGKEDDNLNEDIIKGIIKASKIFHSPTSIMKHPDNPLEFVLLLFTLFSEYKNIHMVHYEIITASMMWSGKNLWRLLENRSNKRFKWISILQVPYKYSWLLGVMFINLKSKILDSLIEERKDEHNSLTNLLTY